MAIIFRTDGAWGAGKGTNLAPSEVDGNFWDLDTRVGTIEDNPVDPVAPIAINIEGSAFTMGLSNGTTLGPIAITYPMPTWRDQWSPSVAYNEMDFFIAPDGGLGAVMIPHTSAASFDWAAIDSGTGLPLYRKLIGASGTTSGIFDLTDVALSGPALDGDLFVYNAATSLWINRTSLDVTRNVLSAFAGDSGSGGFRGLVPAPAAGDAAAGKVLAATGAWIVPPAGSGGGSSSLAGLSDVSIVSPSDLSLLQYRASDGKWHNATLFALGAGTVTQVNSGAGLTGGPVNTTGTLSLAPIGTLNLLANVTGGPATPNGVTLSILLDAVLGTVRGSLLRRDVTGWTPILPGTAGQYLKTGGAGADPSWDNPAGSGTVTQVNSGAGLAGGPITATGTLSLATIADGSLLGNVSGGTAAPAATTLTLLLDHVLGSTQGMVLYRGGTGWAALSPGTAGNVLTTGGSGANPSWAAGTSISIADTPPGSPTPGALWWDSVGGQLYLWYNDGSSSQWVPASNQPGPAAAITSITATAPLTGGGSSGAITIGIPSPLPLANGGTNATSAAAALTSLGAAPLASPAFSGTPSLPTGATGVTQAVATSNTSLATTAFVKSQGYLTGQPRFQVNLTAAQGVTSGTATKVAFNNVVNDPSSAWDAGNRRWRPQVAGWYNIRFTVQYVATTPGVGAFGNSAWIAINGSQGPTGGYNYSANYPSITVAAKILLNGTSDYVEVFVNFAGTAPSVNGGAGPPFMASWFEGEYAGA